MSGNASVATWVRHQARTWFGPQIDQAREWLYRTRFRHASKLLTQRYGARVKPATANPDPGEIWSRLEARAPQRVRRVSLDLSSWPEDRAGERYFQRYREIYTRIGNGREKALEHSLTFELFDLERVTRYCDVASSESPIDRAFAERFPKVEFWRQDLVYETDLRERKIGGFAHEMSAQGVKPGFFDLMALHCSFEHFMGDSDRLWIQELDRVLSARGACMIVPLYLDHEPRILLDPTRLRGRSVETYDRDAFLSPSYGYRQEHGRFYSPDTLCERVLRAVPESLQATLIRFDGAASMSPEIYLRFGLVIHRHCSDAVFRSDLLPSART